MNKEVILSYWRGKISAPVLEAFGAINRENFVLPELKVRAYEDVPLPILREKTISQPSTVLLMTEALELNDGQKVLEIGAGSGYQAALIGCLIDTGKLISTEVVPELVQFARENIAKAGVKNVLVVEQDGSQGYEEEAPYDRIIFTAASPKLPLHLLGQLKENGIMLVPVGDLNSQQMIKLVKKKGQIEQQKLGDFIFSPLIGKFGFDEEKVS